MTRMEIEGAKNGCFNMAKAEGVQACKEYRGHLKEQGVKTYLEHFVDDLFIVRQV